MEIEENLTRGRLVQQTGSYSAWEVGDGLSGAGGVADLAWHCRVGFESHEEHRLLPFCEPSLVLLRRFDREGRTQHLSLRIAPALYEGGAYRPDAGEEQFALRLRPEAMERSLGLRAAEHAGSDAELPPTWHGVFDAALSAAEKGDVQAALGCLVEGLSRLAQAREGDGVAQAARLLRLHPGRVPIDRLAQFADITPRHLRREFARRFGLSPRGLTRRLRLASAMLEAERLVRPGWANIAAGHGFSDQSHMIREFRSILGQAPGDLFRQRRQLIEA